MTEALFSSFIQAGFECSTQRYGGRRLDLLSQTRHDEFALPDYKRLAEFGIKTIRTGARWHLIERAPNGYCFDSLEPTLRAAEETGMQLLVDLLHFGWPDYLDVFDVGFPKAFANFARAVAQHVNRRPEIRISYVPVNEISFFSWVAGDVANMFPHRVGEGQRLKLILVRSAILASQALLKEVPEVRLISPEPVVHIVGSLDLRGQGAQIEQHRLAQFEVWDMLSGRMAPELGGGPKILDIIGLNFYDRNQWIHHGKTLQRTEARYRPFHQIIQEIWERYRRPMFVSETGSEGDSRPSWFQYVIEEVRQAHALGIPVEGVCLYPILNHPGWEDDRHCPNGLFDYADAGGNREIFQPLAVEILHQQEKLRQNATEINAFYPYRSDLSISSPVEFRATAAAASDEPLCS